MVEANRHHGRRAVLAASALPIAARRAGAETWPARPIRLIVGYTAGGPTDLCARVIAEDFRARLPHPVIVENRPGANGSLGAALVAAAPPDGHTLLLSNTSTMTVNHLLYRDIRYAPLRDLLPVASITVSPFLLAINPANPRLRGVRDLPGLIALATARPGRLTYGSGGIGNMQHLNMELFARIAGIALEHVPYRGASLGETALVGGEIDLMLVTPTSVPLMQAGTLLPLATSGETRWRELPAVPTFAEAGYPAFVAVFWNGLVAPAGLPEPIVARLHALMLEAASTPATRQALLPQGDILVLDPRQLRARIAEDIARNAEVIRAAGIEMQ